MNTRPPINKLLTYGLLPACLILLAFLAHGCYKPANGNFARVVQDTNPSIVPLSPEESMKKIQLPPGYHVELVASEPMIQEPVAIAWDGNGRLYVAEMNTYMKDANATGEYAPTSRIKRLEDTDGDGKMDKVTIFVDSLVSRTPERRPNLEPRQLDLPHPR